jgi:large subunit ribosomal protein L13
MNKIIIDAQNGIVGRIASFAAKKALLGNEIVIVNSEKAEISGNKENILSRHLQKRARPNVKFPSRPDMILKRAIRGMVNYKSGRGEQAFDKIKCYVGIPAEYEKEKKIKLERSKGKIKLEKLSGMLK